MLKNSKIGDHESNMEVIHKFLKEKLEPVSPERPKAKAYKTGKTNKASKSRVDRLSYISDIKEVGKAGENMQFRIECPRSRIQERKSRIHEKKSKKKRRKKKKTSTSDERKGLFGKLSRIDFTGARRSRIRSDKKKKTKKSRKATTSSLDGGKATFFEVKGHSKLVTVAIEPKKSSKDARRSKSKAKTGSRKASRSKSDHRKKSPKESSAGAGGGGGGGLNNNLTQIISSGVNEKKEKYEHIPLTIQTTVLTPFTQCRDVKADQLLNANTSTTGNGNGNKSNINFIKHPPTIKPHSKSRHCPTEKKTKDRKCVHDLKKLILKESQISKDHSLINVMAEFECESSIPLKSVSSEIVDKNGGGSKAK